MVEIRSILCPVDFSDASRHALLHAAAIADWYESRIVAQHVVHPVLLPEAPMLYAHPPEAAFLDLREQLHRQLRDWLAPADSVGLKTEAIVEEGVPIKCILDRATSISADLIVVGTHGRSGFDRFMLGSVAEKVLRRAACPVLTVPPSSHSAAKLPYKRLLCPVDFSDSSLGALRHAFSIAKESDAHVTVLHALDWPRDDELLVDQLNTPEFRRSLESRAHARLTALVTDEVRTWCEPETRVCYGKPYRLILETAEHENSDLIVMGVRGRNPVDLSLFGSTTNHVVRRAPCPVLTWKH